MEQRAKDEVQVRPCNCGGQIGFPYDGFNGKRDMFCCLMSINSINRLSQGPFNAWAPASSATIYRKVWITYAPKLITTVAIPSFYFPRIFPHFLLLMVSACALLIKPLVFGGIRWSRYLLFLARLALRKSRIYALFNNGLSSLRR
jgi:hypothetical protein